MLLYITRRVLQGIFVIFLISVITFAIMRLLPGDPVMMLLGDGRIRVTPEQVAAVRHRWGLDQPYLVQYLIWAGNLLRGDFGDSLIRTGVSVRQMIFEAAPVTAFLNLLALGIALIIAIPAGIIAGVRRNSLFDYVTAFFSTLGVALPNYWVALMGIIVFAVWLRWVPVYGLKTWKGYLLPIAVLSTEEMALLARIMRNATIETLGQDYVRTARSKGLAERIIVVRHAVRNALLPVVTVIGVQIAYILSGTIIIETIFALPGIGRLLFDSIQYLDYQVVQSIVVVLAVLVVLVNLLTDLMYAIVDPRIRVE